MRQDLNAFTRKSWSNIIENLICLDIIPEQCNWEGLPNFIRKRRGQGEEEGE